MTGTTNLYRYRINGAIDTSKTVMDNMESIANSAGAWVTYDIMEGKWAVVINKPRDPDAYFNDDNIIGSINVSGTGLSDLYNSVEVQFPHRDLNDQSDFINIEIPDEDRNPNEPDNTLTLSYDQVNEPIQAQLLGLIELKQSRIDLVIQFTTDFSQINIEAGHVIAVTNSIYGWTDKLFRVVSLTEVENESGINIEITALEYDANVYDTTDLYRYLRTNADGIITIGAIGQPGQPQVTKFESASRPRFIVESELPDSTDPLNPAGVIEAMEFWIYQIPSGELPTWELVDDTTRIYTLYKTIPTGPGSGDSTITNIKLDMDNFDPGNFLVKTRCINSTTTGPFSDLSGLVEYTPLQITDAIAPSGQILDKDGNPLGGLLLANLIGWAFSNIGPTAASTLAPYLGLTSGDFTTATGYPAGQNIASVIVTQSDASLESAFNSYTGASPNFADEYSNGNSAAYASSTQSISVTSSLLQIVITCPNGTFDYVYFNPVTNSEETMENMIAFYPAVYTLYYNGNAVDQKFCDWQTSSVTINIKDAPAGDYQIQVQPVPTYDLNQNETTNSRGNRVYPFNYRDTASHLRYTFITFR